MTLFLYCLGYYLLAGLAISLGYHRCLSHRSFQLHKAVERLFITIGLPAGTPIQWAGNHRYHHQNADQPQDPHSPVQGGFWRAHVGWYIDTNNPWICFLYSLAGPLRTLYDGWYRPRTNQQFNYLAQDISKDPYYRFVSRPFPYFIASFLHVLAVYLPAYVLWGGGGILTMWLTSVIVYNVGDAVDSFAHLKGKRPYPSSHLARNNAVLGCLALGDGWHANHHQFPRSARHGLLPHQFDWSWSMICLLKKLGLASHIVVPSRNEVHHALPDLERISRSEMRVLNQVSR